MQAAVLDTLRCAQTLKSAGFPPEQAEATAQVLGDALADVATKADVDRLESKLDDAISGVKSELKAEIHRVDTKLDGMDQRLDGMEKGLDEKIDTRFDALNGKINILIGFVGIMMTAVFGFALFAMSANASSGEPQAAAYNAAAPSATTQDPPNARHARPSNGLEGEMSSSVRERPEPAQAPGG